MCVRPGRWKKRSHARCDPTMNPIRCRGAPSVRPSGRCLRHDAVRERRLRCRGAPCVRPSGSVEETVARKVRPYTEMKAIWPEARLQNVLLSRGLQQRAVAIQLDCFVVLPSGTPRNDILKPCPKHGRTQGVTLHGNEADGSRGGRARGTTLRGNEGHGSRSGRTQGATLPGN